MDTRGYVHHGKTTAFRDLGTLDIGALCSRVAALPEAYWDQHDAQKPNRFDSLGGTRHIVLKFVHKVSAPTEYYELPAWQEWRKDIAPLLDEAARRLGLVHAEFPRVMLARLPAGGDVTQHRDGARFPAFCLKVHLPLLTNPEARFYVEPEWRQLPAGQAVEVNNNAVHAVRNTGNTDRIHLIFELFESPLVLERHTWAGARGG